ncbi:MAG: TIGR02391 family protein [Opitutaceae bacterium]|nr:TIGR02391 family protein [Opitutaceae bacterium]
MDSAVATFPSFDPNVLERICDVLAATDSRLTGTDMGKLLNQLGIADPMVGATKRVRLLEALRQRQTQDHCGNLVVAFVQKAMSPVRHTGAQDWFEATRNDLNTVLAFAGLELGADGQVRPRSTAKTIDQAEQRALRLRNELLRRQVHGDVLKFCTAELVKDDYFHAVLEATKSVSQKIRDKTGLTGDGGDLATKALSLGQVGMPFLAFNSLRNDSEKSEQSGLMTLTVGMFSTFRNPTAHAPRIHWNVSEQDAIDLLTMASFLHRRLDTAARTPRTV